MSEPTSTGARTAIMTALIGAVAVIIGAVITVLPNIDWDDGGPESSSTATASPLVDRVQVPNVYGWPLEEAEAAIRELGFINIRTEWVCSGRIRTAGLVREVLVDVGDPDGTPSRAENRLVGDDGEPLRAELVLDPAERIHIKVATGDAC